MAVSERNRLGVGGANKLSALESQLNANDGPLRGCQPFGALDGRYVQMPADNLLFCAGENWVATEVGTSGSKIVTAPTATLPLRLLYTSGTAGAGDGLNLQYAVAATLGSTTRTSIGTMFPAAGRILAGEMRFRITTTVNNCEMFFGLATAADTTMLSSAGAITVTELVGIRKLRSSALAAGSMSVTGPTTTATVLAPAATIVVNTWHTIGFRVNGISSVEYWFDGDVTGESTVTNIPVGALNPALVFQAATAAAATIEIAGIWYGMENY